MRLRVTVAVLVVLGLLTYGWLHSRGAHSQERLRSTDAVESVHAADRDHARGDTRVQPNPGADSALAESKRKMPGETNGTRGDQTLLQLGRQYIDNEQWPDAVRTLERAVELDPDFFDALFQLAGAYLGRDSEGDEARARDTALAACRKQPARVEGHYNLACAYSRLGEIESGLEALAAARERDQRYVDTMAPDDADLANLRATEGYRRVMEGKSPVSAPR